MEKDETPKGIPQAKWEEQEADKLLALVDLDMGASAYAQALERMHEAVGVVSSLPPATRFALNRRMACCLERLGRAEEARAVALATLSLESPEIPAIERAKCQLVAGRSALAIGLLSAARSDAAAVLDTLGAGSWTAEAAGAKNLLGTVAFRNGEPNRAREEFEGALEIFRTIGDLSGLAGTYVNLGNLHKLRNDWERAAEHYNLAYYLGKTIGDSGIVAGSSQNLGVVLSRAGRIAEARSHLDRVLRFAIEMGDAVRTMRAHLALARVDRTEHDTEGARRRLAACAPTDGTSLPEREHCLLMLEEIRLDLEEGDLVSAGERTAELRLRVEAMAPRGDLMGEVLLVEAERSAAAGEYEEAARSAEKAWELARADRDRSQEEAAQLRLAVVRGQTGRSGEAETALTGLLEKHRARKEWPAVAAVCRELARIACEVHRDPRGAAARFDESIDAYRRCDLSRGTMLAEAERALCAAKLGCYEEARELLESLRSKYDQPAWFPSFQRTVGMIETQLLEMRRADSLDAPDGLQVHERLEEILAAPGSVWERLREILALLKDALAVDGVAFGTVSEGTVALVSTVGLDPGRRVIPLEDLGLKSPSSLSRGAWLDVDEKGVGSGSSRLTITMAIHGRPHALVLARAGGAARRPIGRVESNYAMVLSAEVARALERSTPEGGEEARIAGQISLADIVTQDPRMQRILDLIRRVGDTRLTVLLQGETGTGKKLMAHAIHRASDRRNRPIVTVDCAALPETLLEAELFGYRKGAFTGAAQDRSGLLAEAMGGTAFLDEIDKAGLSVQRRFLHLLDSGEIRPVGATAYQQLDVRIVCATSSPDLRQEVTEGRFLKDLYYRLNDISIEIPPLRERREDILLLAGCFVETYAEQTGRRIRGLSAGFRAALLAHDWPGNVRELEKAIRRAVTLADDDEILTPELLPNEIVGQTQEQEPCATLHEQVARFERTAIQKALDACGGNKSRAAALLGLSRKGLKGKLARYQAGAKRRTQGD